MATLAKGGRTNTMGFVIRLLGNIPFLFIGYRLYGVEAMGRFAAAFVIIEIFALVCALGEKRGLAQRLTEGVEDREGTPSNLVFDGMLASLICSALAVILLLIFPAIIFPSGTSSDYDMWMIAAVPAFALTEILLAAQAYRYDIATTVRARAIVEPWTRSILVGVLFYVPGVAQGGLSLAFLASIYAGLLIAAYSFYRTYGMPTGWRPRPRYLGKLAARALPLVGADVIERGTRLIDVFLLGQFTSPAAVGIYFFAKEIASLPQKLKSSFEPILSPVITKNLKIGNMEAIAAQVRQVGFWIIALQLGIALMIAIPGEAVMGLGGPAIVGGTGALALLLAAEVVASMAVVSESVLVYIAKKRNLAISVGVITSQALMTVGFILLARHLGLDEGFMAGGAALALFIALGLSSIVKAAVLKNLLKAPVSNWRWALVWATGPAVIVGFCATLLPEWAELVFGTPAILGTYLYVIWKRGFGPEDKVLFKKNIVPVDPEPEPAKPA
ncbi:lipopolysaccharide biosynthesis protein [Erythrobacter sp. THAF29]|uniref:lipopolysaccharide biosynthesis protein n=1 Tax=Erythrobacter sp. THAF29 TaxID=2587851 RepID=UPI0012690359|nr:lipopolysaccharide biosynthesis protein [Erythrobacter sp. THAF29]QFT78462.1 Polysaccharide biosynthesis protein [Erythrobacter sp. THAF29]